MHVGRAGKEGNSDTVNGTRHKVKKKTSAGARTENGQSFQGDLTDPKVKGLLGCHQGLEDNQIRPETKQSKTQRSRGHKERLSYHGERARGWDSGRKGHG